MLTFCDSKNKTKPQYVTRTNHYGKPQYLPFINRL